MPRVDELDHILAESTAAIDAEYFLLPIDGGNPVYRERVYCYELYHQMRMRWPPQTQCRYLLNGEVDKRGHELMRRRGVSMNRSPDLLVHCPGFMDGNHAIIEVKPSIASLEGIRKDLTTLALFRNLADYQRGIYLIYGHSVPRRFAQRIEQVAAVVDRPGGLEVWFHSDLHAPARRFGILRETPAGVEFVETPASSAKNLPKQAPIRAVGSSRIE